MPNSAGERQTEEVEVVQAVVDLIEPEVVKTMSVEAVHELAEDIIAALDRVRSRPADGTEGDPAKLVAEIVTRLRWWHSRNVSCGRAADYLEGTDLGAFSVDAGKPEETTMTGEEVAAWAAQMAQKLQASADRAKDRDARLVLMAKAGSFRVVADRAAKPARDNDPKPKAGPDGR